MAVAGLARAGGVPGEAGTGASSVASMMRHGTTVLALRFEDGVVLAGDRRATEGHLIAYRTMEKVIQVDELSGVAIAGVAGPAIELVRLFATQLEHYEKVEGVSLSIEGKANQLGQLVSGNLPMAMQGMVVIPLFAGFDDLSLTGRVFSFDVTGGRYEESDYATEGSGGRNAKSALKMGWFPGMGRDDAVRLSLEAIVEAADEDVATGGPDPVRGIYPTVAVITRDGFGKVDAGEVAERVAGINDAAVARLRPGRVRGRGE